MKKNIKLSKVPELEHYLPKPEKKVTTVLVQARVPTQLHKSVKIKARQAGTNWQDLLVSLLHYFDDNYRSK